MKVNLPVTQTEKPWVEGRYIVSKTDLKGAITYVNDAFVDMSGYSREELLGKNHNIVRHPDVPPQAFADLWTTLKEGRPWRGIVKNRCKNGDHYWVDAMVVPIRQGEAVIGYVSVRTRPASEQVRQAEAVYRQLNQSKAAIRPAGRLKRLTIKARLAMIMAFMAAAMLSGGLIGLSGMMTSNKALEADYKDRLEPSGMIGRVMLLMNENRGQVMLALQHNPDNPLARLHNHPLTVHTDAIAKNRDEITALWAEYVKRNLSPAERALAERYAAARGRYVQEGLVPARAALLAGDYGTANRLLLEKVDPLYQAANSEADALLKQTLDTARQEYHAAVERYALIRNLAIAGTVGGILLAAAFALLLIRAIVGPLRQAVGHFVRISQGDLTGEIDISGRDEAGCVVTELAAMQAHLQVMLDEIREASHAIGTRCTSLHGQMSQVVDHSDHQQERVQEVAATLEEVSQSVTEVADAAEETARAAEHSATIVGSSNAQMSQSMEATARVVEAVQQSSGTIAELNQAIQKIGDITQAIKEIADQTNLLALNAAIEAARAGEQGRGFAVVADEVRKLAERTASSTTDIAETVGEIQSATRQAVASMDQAVREVEEGIGLMKASGGSLREIAHTSDQVTEMAQHIASAAKQQSAATESVAGSMAKISELIEGNTAAAQQAWQATEELSKTAEGLLAVVRQFEVAQ